MVRDREYGGETGGGDGSRLGGGTGLPCFHLNLATDHKRGGGTDCQ